MLLTPDLRCESIEKLSLRSAPDIFQPAYGYYSMTELSEYTTTEEEYKKQLLTDLQAEQETRHRDGAQSPTTLKAAHNFELRLTEWRERI